MLSIPDFCPTMTLVVLLTVTTASAATYYASPSGGGTTCAHDAPCSLAGGIAALRSGDTLYLRGGTYTDSLSYTTGMIIPNGGGSWDTATTVASAPGETARLRGGNPGVLLLPEGASWLIFDRLIFDGSALSGLQEVIFLNVTDIHHIRISNSEVGPGPHHAIAGAGAFLEFLNLSVHDVPSYGWYFGGNHSLFKNNTVAKTGGYAFHIYESKATNVSNNTLDGNRITGCGYASLDWLGNYRPTHGLIISSGSNNVVQNNILSGNWGGIQVGDTCLNCKVYNNTVVGNTVGSGLQIGSGYGADNVEVINNISYQNAGGDLEDYNPAGKVLRANLIGTDPRFADADFRLLAESPARNTGETLPSVPTDCEDAPRGQGGAYDMGAREYGDGGGITPSRRPRPVPRNLRVVTQP